MKFIHLSDLHIGKRVNEFSMIEDQEYILAQIVDIAMDKKPEAVFICGDVYDKSIPPSEAVAMFDRFLVTLAKNGIKVFVISGNHDSAARIAFGSKLMNASGVYMSPVFNGDINPITLCDEYGEIDIFMLPFVKPVHVRTVYSEDKIDSYDDAIRLVVKNMNIDKQKRNVLLTHQFVTGSERSESEDISVGGTDNVSGKVFEDFDYVALGHIHKPQSVGRKTLRYCGTPLKYSFSEAKHEKSVTVVEFGVKNDITINTIPLTAKRDMVEIKGAYNQIISKKYYDNLNTDDYFHITLTDEEDVPDAMNKLRTVYKNIMKLDYQNKRTSKSGQITPDNKTLSPIELMSQFYQKQNNLPLSDTQEEFLSKIIADIWEKQQ